MTARQALQDVHRNPAVVSSGWRALATAYMVRLLS